MISSTYDLCSRFISYILPNSDTETPQCDTILKSNTTEEAHSTELQSVVKPQPYRKSLTPYKDALMKGLVTYRFLNRTPEYYSDLGNKINEIVEKRYNKRSYGRWWVDEYLREAFIGRNRFLQRHDYYVQIKTQNKDDNKNVDKNE